MSPSHSRPLEGEGFVPISAKILWCDCPPAPKVPTALLSKASVQVCFQATRVGFLFIKAN